MRKIRVATARGTWSLPLAMLMLVSVLAVSACNTMEGAGEDLQSAGGALEDKAEDANE